MDLHLQTLHIPQEAPDNLLPGIFHEGPVKIQPASPLTPEMGVLNQQGAAGDGFVSLDPPGRMAALSPAGPPPTTITSQSYLIPFPFPSEDRG